MALDKLKKSTKPKAVFYTFGSHPTDEEIAAMEKINNDFDVVIRNGTTMRGNPEPAEKHFGAVPSYFEDAGVDKAKIERHDFSAKKEAKKSGGAAAPAA